MSEVLRLQAAVYSSCPVLSSAFLVARLATPWTVLLHAVMLSVARSSLSRFIFVQFVMLFNHVVFGLPLFLIPDKVPWIMSFSKSYASQHDQSIVAFWPLCLMADLTLQLFQEPSCMFFLLSTILEESAIVLAFRMLLSWFMSFLQWSNFFIKQFALRCSDLY